MKEITPAVKRKAQKILENSGNVELAQLEATMELADKIEELTYVVETQDKIEIPKIEMPEHKETNKALLSIVEELKKEKDNVLKLPLDVEVITLKGNKGEKGDSIKGDPGEPGYTPIKGVDYFDGENGKDGKDGSPDTGEQIVAKINALEIEEDLQIDASHIKNFPKEVKKITGGVIARNIYQLGDVNLTSLNDGDTLVWNNTTKLWEPGAGGGGGTWGSITGTLSDQTDLQTALDTKIDTLGAIGATPNANGATITGTVLNLEPASASYGGVVTTTSQTFVGEKTILNQTADDAFSASLQVQQEIINTGNRTGDTHLGSYSKVTITDDFNHTTETGAGNLGEVIIDGDGTISGSLVGSYGQFTLNGVGTVDYGIGNGGTVSNNSTGTITTAIGSNVDVENTGGGTITTAIGFNVGTLDGTTKIGINADIAGSKNIFHEVQLKAASSLKFYDTDSSNFVAFKGAGTIASDITWTLPTTDSTGTQVLVSDGSGNLSWANNGVVTLGAIGSTPNANGATISGSTLNLQPASASFGGVVTTTAQTFAGLKTFDGGINTGTITYPGMLLATTTGGFKIRNTNATGYTARFVGSDDLSQSSFNILANQSRYAIGLGTSFINGNWVRLSPAQVIVENNAGALTFAIDTGLSVDAGSYTPTERMRLTTTGLGVGNTSPSYKIDVTGDIRASVRYYIGTSTNAYIEKSSGSGIGIVAPASGGYLDLVATGATGVRLHAATNYATVYASLPNISSTNQALAFGADSVGSYRAVGTSAVVLERNAGDFIINANTGLAGSYATFTPTERVRVVGATGYVGINQNSPACMLDVVGGIKTSRTAVTSPASTDGNIFSGTYTPTLTAVTNVDATTARKCTYMRVGNVVTVAGQMDIDPTGAGTTVVGISLPIASNFATAYEAGGVGHAPAVAGHGAAIYADATNNRVELSYVDGIGSNDTMTFTFTYEII